MSSSHAESRQRLWIVPGPLVVWAAHFMVSYITAALWCGRLAGRGGSLGSVQLMIGLYTVAALASLFVIGRIAFQAHAQRTSLPPYDADSPQDRHRFVALAALMTAE